MTTDFTHYSDIKVDGKVESSRQGNLVGSKIDMPTPSADNLNLIVLYTGLETSKFKPNKFYQCQTVGSSQYDWIQLPIGSATSVSFVEIQGNARDNASLKTELDKHTEKLIETAHGKSLIFNEASGGGSKFEFADGSEAFVGVNDNTGSATMPCVQMYADKKNASTGKYEGSLINLFNEMGTYVSKEERAKGEYVTNKSKYEFAVRKDVNPMVLDVDFTKVVL